MGLRVFPGVTSGDWSKLGKLFARLGLKETWVGEMCCKGFKGKKICEGAPIPETRLRGFNGKLSFFVATDKGASRFSGFKGSSAFFDDEVDCCDDDESFDTLSVSFSWLSTEDKFSRALRETLRFRRSLTRSSMV